MTQSDLILFAAVAVLACNHAILRIPGWLERLWLFWLVQALNVSAACYMLLVGIPEFQGQLVVANWMLGLLMIWHTVSNNRRLQRARTRDRQANGASDRKAQIRAALQAGEE